MAAKKKSPVTAGKKPAKKPAPKPAAKSAARKPATKKSPAKRPMAAAAVTADDLLTQLASHTRLSRDEVLDRALRSLAAATGFAFASPTVTAPLVVAAPVQPAPAPGKKAIAAPTPPPERLEHVPLDLAPIEPAAPVANKLPDYDNPPALAPDVRLYVHGVGRPPTEMMKDVFIIGTGPKSDLQVLAPKIEARHLRIERDGRQYFATDLTESKTILHGVQIAARQELKHEDTLYLAGFHRVRVYLVE